MLDTNQVSIDKFRTNLAEYIGRVMYGKDRIVIKKYNREAAVLLSRDEYECLLDPTRRLTYKEWKERFQKLDRIRKNIPVINPSIIEKTVSQTVRQVRAEKRRRI